MKMHNLLRRVALFLGICFCTYPLISSMLEQKNQRDTVATYQREIEKSKNEDVVQMFKDAETYNTMLYQSKSSIVSNLKEGVSSSKHYETILNVSGTGVMGALKIPQISVELPIYHGTEKEVLSIGVGHLEGSSLPVGGKNTHSVLTGHRGLPNSKLFTRLDELDVGDLFYIEIGDRILAYVVTAIEVISPENIEGLEIQKDKDLVSLITCTPYGINTHRLVVIGERTAYEEEEYINIAPQIASMREIGFMILPFILIGLVVVKYVKERRNSREQQYTNHIG